MRRLAIAFVVLALALAGCRGGSATPGGGNNAGGIKTDVGVTKEACPQAVNANHGCIYLGSISDLTSGPFKALAVPITESQKAFWARVNKAGGIGNYDVDVTTYVRDLGVGVRGRHHRVRCELLHRVDERAGLREGDLAAQERDGRALPR